MKRIIPGVVFIATAATFAAAESEIENPIDTINKHYAIASEHYGDGKVKIHSRSDGEAGSQHSVLTVNCKEQTFNRDYLGAEPPNTFGEGEFAEPSKPLSREYMEAPIAEHACAEHGHPLLEWRW